MRDEDRLQVRVCLLKKLMDSYRDRSPRALGDTESGRPCHSTLAAFGCRAYCYCVVMLEQGGDCGCGLLAVEQLTYLTYLVSCAL